MASFFPKSASVFLLTLFCFLSLIILLLQSSSDCNVGSAAGCVSIMERTMEGLHQKHRKLLASLTNNEMVFKNGMATPATHDEGKNVNGWELRTAPLGPDPLHHHGGSPRPRITP